MNKRLLLAGLVSAIVLAGGALVACSPLTAINAITPSSGYQLSADIAYGADAANARQQLDIYVPRAIAGAASSTALPVVVFFYGGSWNEGSRKDYAFVGEALSSRGVIAVVADYRVYPQVRYPEFVRDSAQAVAWTLQHIAAYGGDAQRVFVMGHSAGAYNAAMVALDGRWLQQAGATPRQLRGWIGLAGPYDFLPIDVKIVQPVFNFPDTPPDSQPARHVSAASPPALLIASHQDSVVDAVRNTAGMARLLRQQHVPVEEIYFDNTSHASLVGSLARPLRSLAPTLDRIIDFIMRQSAGPHPATQAQGAEPSAIDLSIGRSSNSTSR